MDAMQKAAQEPKQAQPSKGVSLKTILAPGKWFLKEMLLPALEKLIPQGAAELSQALFTENSYVPYGPTEKPIEIEDDQLNPQQKTDREHIAPMVFKGKELER